MLSDSFWRLASIYFSGPSSRCSRATRYPPSTVLNKSKRLHLPRRFRFLHNRSPIYYLPLRCAFRYNEQYETFSICLPPDLYIWIVCTWFNGIAARLLPLVSTRLTIEPYISPNCLARWRRERFRRTVYFPSHPSNDKISVRIQINPFTVALKGTLMLIFWKHLWNERG